MTMKLWKRMLAGALGLALCASLAGCGPDAEQGGPDAANLNAPAGRWVESQPLEDSTADLTSCYFYDAPTQMADGALWLLGVDYGQLEEGQPLPLYRWSSSDDGASWNRETLDWPAHTGSMITCAALRPDGAAFLQSREGEEGTTRFWLRSAAGEYTELPLQKDIPGLYDVHEAWLLEGDILALNPEWTEEGRDGLVFYDIRAGSVLGSAKAGDAESTVSGGEGDAVYVCTLCAAAAAADRMWLVYRNAASGRSELAQVRHNGELDAGGPEIPGSPYELSAAVDADGNYYYCSSSGICRVAAGGSLIEQLIDGDGYSYGVAQGYGLCRTDQGSFLMAAYTNTGTSVYRYAWDDTLPAAGFGEALQVWSLRDSSTVRAAIVELGKTHPEIEVHYTVALGDESGLTEDDALTALNTELLAGGGPDLLILDGMDCQSMAAQGLLAELGGMVDTGTLLPNIAGPFAQGPVTVLPARFTLPVLYGGAGSMARVDTLDKLAAAAAAGKTRPDLDATEDAFYGKLPEEDWYAFSMLDTETLLDFALQTCEPALLNENGADGDALLRLYRFIQEVGDGLGMQDYRSAAEHTRVGSASSWYNSDTILSGESFYEYRNRAQYGWDEMGTPAMLHIAEEVMIRPGLVEGAYLPSTLVGVNAAARHPGEAAALAAAIFSPAVQGSYQEDGMPVLAEAMDRSFERNRQCIEDGAYTGDARALIAGAKTPVIRSAQLYAKLLPHARAVVSGGETPEQAAQSTVQDLALMLAEKR